MLALTGIILMVVGSVGVDLADSQSPGSAHPVAPYLFALFLVGMGALLILVQLCMREAESSLEQVLASPSTGHVYPESPDHEWSSS